MEVSVEAPVGEVIGYVRQQLVAVLTNIPVCSQRLSRFGGEGSCNFSDRQLQISDGENMDAPNLTHNIEDFQPQIFCFWKKIF